MRYLVADQGNTRLKVAIFDGEDMVKSESFGDCSCEIFSKFIEGESIDGAILSSSADFKFDIVGSLKNHGAKVIENFSHQTPIPLKNMYDTPETLGQDRLLAAIAAAEQFPEKDVIIFDLGTAITIDIVTKEGEYIGGAISPGMMMRFQALHNQTDRLPLLDFKIISKLKECYLSSKVASNTKEAIFYGVVEGIRHEIEGYIRQNCEKEVYFTGGDALFFDKLINFAIFVNCNSTLLGLRAIIEKICLKEL